MSRSRTIDVVGPLCRGLASRAAGLCAVGLLSLAGSASPAPIKPVAPAGLPLYFISNQGQMDERVRFYEQSKGHTAFFTSEGVYLSVLSKSDAPGRPRTRQVVKLTTLGANPAPDIVAERPQKARINSFIGDDPARWKSDIPTYGAVLYREIYPGIDIRFHGKSRALEYDVIVKPGADPSVLRLALQGIEGLSLAPEGQLRMTLKEGEVVQKAPSIYQEIGGRKVEVEGRFKIHRSPSPGDSKGLFVYGFELGRYDKSHALVIDPTLFYSSYLGGNNTDRGFSIVLHGDGTVFVTGNTDSPNFDTTPGAWDRNPAGFSDVFVSKFDVTLAGAASLVYSTYVGGNADDEGRGIEVDSDTGEAYVTGFTEGGFPTTAGARDTTFNGNRDAFLTKLNAAGSALLYSTYLGSNGQDEGLDIALDADNNIAYLTGRTNAAGFPTTASAFDPTFNGGRDAFISVFNAAGSAVTYSTYLGGTSDDDGFGITVDGSGNLYVSGQTNSNPFPTSAGAFDTTFNGSDDGFVAKFNPSLSGAASRIYSTYLGGSNTDGALSISVDASGGVCLTGYTVSIDFPTVAPLQAANAGNRDIFVSHLNAAGSALTFSTYLGGGSSETGEGVDIVGDRCCITGRTESANYPTTAGAFQTTNGGGIDVCVTCIAAVVTRATIRGLRVDPAGVVEFATGSQQDTAAFNLYEVMEDGERLLLNAEPILAPVPTSHAPILYRAEVGVVTGRSVLIEEIDTRGRKRLMGPFETADQDLARALDRVRFRLNKGTTREVRGSRMAVPGRAGRGQAAPRARVKRARVLGGSSRGIKIEVGEPGLVTVPVADLRALGLPPGFPLRTLTLTNHGTRVPFSVIAQAIVFKAEVLSTAYTGFNVYVLSWRGGAPVLEAPLTLFEAPAPQGFVRVEKNTLYIADAPQGTDPWMWDLLFADGAPWPGPWDPTAGDFDLKDLAPGTGPVAVRIQFLGRTEHSHTVEAWINGVVVGSVTFTGAEAAVLEGEVPLEALLPQGNQLTLSYSADGSDGIGLAYLRQLDVAAPKGPPSSVEAALSPYDPTLPLLGSANYLIVTHALFRAEADRIAGLKAAEGHRPAVVDVERAYDRFSAGIPEAAAVRALIQQAAVGGRLKNVLLVGDDTFDTHDYLGTGAVAFIPSLLGWDGIFGRIPSENLYADLNGDGRPEVAIGRLPVQTPAQAGVLADKIARQASVLRASAGRHLFAVDNHLPGLESSFRAEAAAAVSQLPSGASVSWADVDGDVATARANLFAALQSGVAMTHYFGHGGPEIWADENLLDVTSVGGVQGPETVIFTWSCETQWYQYLFGPTVSEALLLLPQGGAVASLGPAGITDSTLQSVFSSRVYLYLLREGRSLGEAVRLAKAAAMSEDPRMRGVVEGWNLLGDPALVLGETRGYRP